MKASEIRKDKELMAALESVAGYRTIKTHNCEMSYDEKIKHDYSRAAWIKRSLLEVYKRPSIYKMEIDEKIRRDVDSVFEPLHAWEYAGGAFAFTMAVDVLYNGHIYGLDFTRDNLHVVMYE